jgi:hypothetical protein
MLVLVAFEARTGPRAVTVRYVVTDDVPITRSDRAGIDPANAPPPVATR